MEKINTKGLYENPFYLPLKTDMENIYIFDCYTNELEII